MAGGFQQSGFAAYAESGAAWDSAAAGGACEPVGSRSAGGRGRDCAWRRGILGRRSGPIAAADLGADGVGWKVEPQSAGGGWTCRAAEAGACRGRVAGIESGISAGGGSAGADRRRLTRFACSGLGRVLVFAKRRASV